MTQLKTQTGTEAEFFKRGRDIAKAADAGKAIPETHLLTFADPADMLAVSTPKRLELFKALRVQRIPLRHSQSASIATAAR
ncbi:hypothetical protein [Comamonas endophytica]|uniref:Uncharacterized protein n=1 Tax=Comamonas endophytica TaxID=2949090 RepID=A0ABY6GFS5_9BURK|nr:MULTISPECIES: hypothetical protein [unclassified Acidovorax]MCD2513357.1 hypothetical protein [Acidovorax sp. D4N7]UYG53941.1 hypothetical protein M9799_18160 [Acidovorax sp. 5MLIR]